MKKLASIVAAVALAVPALAKADTWNIDGSHTRVGFAVRHLLISDVKGEFGKVAGKASIDDANLAKSSVEVSIEAASIDTRDAKRDEHLRNPDFLETPKFPAITFKSTKVEGGADGKVKVTGDLTIRGITKPVTLEGELTKEIKDPWGNQRRGFSASTKIDRREFEVKYDPSGAGVGHELRIDVQSELVKAK
jgi:polyisoprenoid-binding protein YceI